MTHGTMDERDLIYDWNRAAAGFDWTRARVVLNDETLRDGLQSPSVRDPDMDTKRRLLHLMADLGIAAADIGLPGAGPRVVEQVRALAREIRDHRLPIAPNCAARTVIADVRPIAEVSQRVGIPIEAATFTGSSPIRQYTEGWTLDRMLRATTEAVGFAVADAERSVVCFSSEHGSGASIRRSGIQTCLICHWSIVNGHLSIAQIGEGSMTIDK